MKIWLPYVRCDSGVDVYTEDLAKALEGHGCQVVIEQFGHWLQYAPGRLKRAPVPPNTDVVLANTWNGFAFYRSGVKLVVVEHHCIFDREYAPYRGLLQSLFHLGMIRRFEQSSLNRADALVAVSAYTAQSVELSLGGPKARVIHNGIDVNYFRPDARGKTALENRRCRLLFIGNQSRRKGADLLPKIMANLGQQFELHYTSGLRADSRSGNLPNMHPLGRLSRTQLLEAYREADILLFPTRFEGFGYAVAEAMACGTPVVTTASSSLPELVEDGVTGCLCPIDDVAAYANAIRKLVRHPQKLAQMGNQARLVAETRFSMKKMVEEYLALFNQLLEGSINKEHPRPGFGLQ